MKDALVSIITPSYNSEKFIGETIASVQRQTHTHWEMIVVDDASHDNTTAVVSKMMQSDQRIKLVTLDQNAGPAVARNIGIEQASGKFMTFLDADDIWLPNFISVSIETIQRTKIPFVFASYHRTDEDLNPVYSDFIVPDRVTYTDILKTNSISCLTAFLDIGTLGKKKMPEVFKRQDMGLWLRYLKEIPFAQGIKQPLAIYRIRKNSLSRKKSRLLKYQWEFYRNVENLSWFSSCYFMCEWMWRGFMKYRR